MLVSRLLFSFHLKSITVVFFVWIHVFFPSDFPSMFFIFSAISGPFLHVSLILNVFRWFLQDSFALGKTSPFHRLRSKFDRISSLIICKCYNVLPFLRFMFLRHRFIVRWLIWLSYKSYIYSTCSMQSLHHLVAGFCFCFLLFLSLLWSYGVRNVITLIIWSWKGGGGRGCASQMHNHLCFLCCCFCFCFSSSCFCSCSCFSCSRSCWPYYARSVPNHCSVDSAWIWAYVCWCPSLWFCCHRQNTQKKQISPLQTCMWSKN